jgi:hypothetical protein
MKPATARRLPRPLITAALTFTASIASFAATTDTARAAPRSGSFAASLASPLTEPRREIIDGTLWRCEGDRCNAVADGSRAVMTCRKVSKKFGTVSRFSTPDGDLSTEDLSRCNASA